MSRSRVGLFAVALTLLGLYQVHAAPDFPVPNPYPLSWELKFTHAAPKRIAVAAPGEQPKGYWYVTYTITNDGEKEQLFFPAFNLLTADGKVHQSDHGVPKRVFEQIKTETGKKLLEPFTSVTGPIRLGPAESRDSVAIWPETNPDMGHFSIFVTGLSGESVAMKMVDGKLTKISDARQIKEAQDADVKRMKEAQESKTPVDPNKLKELTVLYKTLQLNYFIRGDDVFPGEDEVNEEAEQWIMR